MPASVTFALASAVPALAVIVGIVIDCTRLNDLRRHFDARMDQLLKHIEER
jgi:hypothetical protein